MHQIRNPRYHSFDASKNFVWLRTVRVKGVAVTKGAAVDKTRFAPDRLQRMYESLRLINYAPGQRPRKRGAKV